ncbi:hypothetical protein, partial [Massilia glaciei]
MLIMFLIGALGWLVHMNATMPRHTAVDEPPRAAALAPHAPAAGALASLGAADDEPLPPLVLVKTGHGAAPRAAPPVAALA